MNRAERRRQAKAEKRENATYNVSRGQIRKIAEEQLTEAYDDGFRNGMNKALTLMWCLPLMVLRDHFWQKTFKRQAKKFCEELFDLYSRWQDGELDILDIQEDLWEYGGIKLQEGEDS